METGRLAKQALTLAPDLAEAHVALGVFHYYGFRQYEPALTEFQRAIELQPNNSVALQFVAYVHRRQGKWDRTLEELERSIEQDPRNAIRHGKPCGDLFLSAQVERSRRHWPACPDHRPARGDRHAILLLSSLNRTGNAQEPLRLLATFPPDDLLVPNTGMFDMVIGRRGETFVLGRDFDAALKAWETGTAARTNEWQRFAAKAGIRVLAGDVAGAQQMPRKLANCWRRDCANSQMIFALREH